MFFYIAQIIDIKRPKAFFLENVRHLLKHDNGKTIETIRHILEDELGYSLYYKIIKASDFGLPQHRPRIFLVGFKEDNLNNFMFPDPVELKTTMSDIWGGNCDRDIGLTLRVGGRSSPIDDRRNWDGYRVDGKVKRLTSKEGKAMQGFPEKFKFKCSETQAMKQLGNSVAIPAVQSIANEMIIYLNQLKDGKNCAKR